MFPDATVSFLPLKDVRAGVSLAVHEDNGETSHCPDLAPRQTGRRIGSMKMHAGSGNDMDISKMNPARFDDEPDPQGPDVPEPNGPEPSEPGITKP